jgi:hypothetical protein
MKLPVLLFLFFPLFCFSQDIKYRIHSDTIIINTQLSDTAVFRLDTFKSESGLVAWFSLVNDSGKEIIISNISTSDGGTNPVWEEKHTKVLKSQ